MLEYYKQFSLGWLKYMQLCNQHILFLEKKLKLFFKNKSLSCLPHKAIIKANKRISLFLP